MANIQDNQDYYDESFNKIDISGQNVDSAVFEKCEFINCDFSSVTFSHCKFVECVFEQCNLSLIKVINTRFANVEFSDCKLVGIDWTAAYWPKFDFYSELIFKQSILDNCSFFGLKLHESYFEGCRLHDVDFRYVEFNKSSLLDCDFSNSLFLQTNLELTDFTESHSFNIDIRQNTLSKAIFSKFEALELLKSLDIQLVD
ncbi:pentapeptide repeat-containing protein [Providencia burhodogranariea]|uniref:Pentapeptide repeat protein n=1 Tax=Providencia burhodogranariea DSM 19968 TaxID=1141662 RepID=K8WX91_9GAMM|nr:pentapeptide repeat protein [Providencia burhodogranariea DSM 19968]